MDSGSTQSNGMTATSCVMTLLVASSITEAHAANENHSTLCELVIVDVPDVDAEDDDCASAVPKGLRSSAAPNLRTLEIHMRQAATNSTKPALHIQL